MTEMFQVYKCEVCGNIVEIVHKAMGKLVCCGKPMVLKNEIISDGAVEKHVPVITRKDELVVVTVGEIEHPMEEEHYIEWIEVITSDNVYRRHLKPGEKPEAKFNMVEEILYARSYCNKHGLWKGELK